MSGSAGRRAALALAALAGALPIAAASAPSQAPPPASAAAAGVEPFAPAAPLEAERLRGLRPEVVRAILAGEPGGEIALAALALPVPAAGPGGRVALFVEIDGATFLDSNQASVAAVEIYAYALTASGAVAGYLAEAFTLDVARHGEAVWSGGLRYLGWLELPPGAYELRVLAYNARSLAGGLTSTRLVVPAPEAPQPLALPPLLAGLRVPDPWLGVRGRAGWPAAGGYPFVVGGRALLPSARPVLVAGRAAIAHLLADRLPPPPFTGTAELSADAAPRGAPGDPPAEPRLVAAAPIEAGLPRPAASGLTAVDFRFLVPAAPPGRYRLRLRLDTPAGPLVSPAATVLLIEAGPQDRELLWSDLKALDGASPAPPEPSAPPSGETVAERPSRRSGGQRARRLAAAYRQALAATAAAAPGRPVALMDFELAVLGRGGEDLAWLRAAELQAAAALGRREAELLVPLIALHDELFQLYRRRHLFSLVAHSRRLLEALAELYAELGGDPETAAGALASAGGYMQELRAPGDSRRLFERALAIDPDNPPALLGLASTLEKHGEYGAAVERLERLATAWPEIREASLRLALNLERIGARQRFRELLAGLAADAESDWVSAIACQELARSLVAAGSLAEAAALLEAAVSRMPERQALWLLLAHVYDRQGQLGRSLDSLRRVAAAPAAGRASERLTYDAWANGPLERARRALGRQAAELRPRLGRELARRAAVRP